MNKKHPDLSPVKVVKNLGLRAEALKQMAEYQIFIHKPKFNLFSVGDLSKPPVVPWEACEYQKDGEACVLRAAHRHDLHKDQNGKRWN